MNTKHLLELSKIILTASIVISSALGMAKWIPLWKYAGWADQWLGGVSVWVCLEVFAAAVMTLIYAGIRNLIVWLTEPEDDEK